MSNDKQVVAVSGDYYLTANGEVVERVGEPLLDLPNPASFDDPVVAIRYVGREARPTAKADVSLLRKLWVHVVGGEDGTWHAEIRLASDPQKTLACCGHAHGRSILAMRCAAKLLRKQKSS